VGVRKRLFEIEKEGSIFDDDGPFSAVVKHLVFASLSHWLFSRFFLCSFAFSRGSRRFFAMKQKELAGKQHLRPASCLELEIGRRKTRREGQNLDAKGRCSSAGVDFSFLFSHSLSSLSSFPRPPPPPPFSFSSSQQNKIATKGHGILAMDESNATCGKRLDSIGMENTEANRLAYRELLVTTPNLGDFISGAILFEETLYQTTSTGKTIVQCLNEQNIVPGIKTDKGLVPLVNSNGESWCQGLDGLAQRSADYYKQVRVERCLFFRRNRSLLSFSCGRPRFRAMYLFCFFLLALRLLGGWKLVSSLRKVATSSVGENGAETL